MNNYGGSDRNLHNKGMEINRNVYTNANQSENYLERCGPHRENLKVLHKDGSFADLPDRDIEGAGAQSAAMTK